MSDKMPIEKKQCMTPNFRASYPAVFKPAKAMDDGKEPKFEITMLYDKKTTDLKELKRVIANAKAEQFGTDAKKWPQMHSPIRDGDTELKDGEPRHAGHWFVKATSKFKPQVIGANTKPITEESGEFYAGCYARALLTAFYYEVKGRKGVSFYFDAVQKMKDGEKFGGRRDAAQVFGVVEDGSDDAENYGEETEDNYADLSG